MAQSQRQSFIRFWQRYRLHFRRTISLSAPVIVGQLGFVLMGVIDNLMIGQLGYTYLSAASLANSIFFILTVVGLGITFAISPLVAEAAASGNREKVGTYLRQGVWVTVFSALIINLLIAGSVLLLPYLDQPAEDIALADSYLLILNASVLPMMLFFVYKQFSDGLSQTRPAMFITLIGLVFNTGANWLLIFGNLGLPRLELDGAGYATLSSRILMLVLMAAYVMYSRRFTGFDTHFRWKEFVPAIQRKILDIGLPSGLQYFFEVGAFGGAVILIGWLGMAERSAHQIVISLASISYMVVSGLAAGASIRVGGALGRRNFTEVRRAGMAGIYLAAGFMSIAGVVFVVGRNWFPAFYVEEVAVLEMASVLMIIAGFFAIFDGVQAVAVGVLRGVQDVRIPTLITFVAYWVICLPVSYLLGFTFELGLNGIWYGFVISLAFASVALTRRFVRLTNKWAAERKAEILLQRQDRNSGNAKTEELIPSSN